MTGFVHSTESFGTVDGPGIRPVLFMQGCPLRCLYCHNPDTWSLKGGKEITVDEVLEIYNRNKSFYGKGGITATGGEPLLQIDFLTELFKRAKDEGIHTCVDTSGITFNPCDTEKMDALMKLTDLVILDLKMIDPVKHKALTGKDNRNILAFARYLKEKNIPMWISHVVVPGYTDSEEDLVKLGDFIAPLKNVKALNVLPYHTMGITKYEQLNIPYRLEGVEPMPADKAKKAKEIILQRVRLRRSK